MKASFEVSLSTVDEDKFAVPKAFVSMTVQLAVQTNRAVVKFGFVA